MKLSAGKIIAAIACVCLVAVLVGEAALVALHTGHTCGLDQQRTCKICACLEHVNTALKLVRTLIPGAAVAIAATACGLFWLPGRRLLPTNSATPVVLAVRMDQ